VGYVALAAATAWLNRRAARVASLLFHRRTSCDAAVRGAGYEMIAATGKELGERSSICSIRAVELRAAAATVLARRQRRQSGRGPRSPPARRSSDAWSAGSRPRPDRHRRPAASRAAGPAARNDDETLAERARELLAEHGRRSEATLRRSPAPPGHCGAPRDGAAPAPPRPSRRSTRCSIQLTDTSSRARAAADARRARTAPTPTSRRPRRGRRATAWPRPARRSNKAWSAAQRGGRPPASRQAGQPRPGKSSPATATPATATDPGRRSAARPRGRRGIIARRLPLIGYLARPTTSPAAALRREQRPADRLAAIAGCAGSRRTATPRSTGIEVRSSSPT